MSEQNKESKGLFKKIFGNKPDNSQKANLEQSDVPVQKKSSNFGSLKLQYKTGDGPKGPTLKDIRSNFKPTSSSLRPITKRSSQGSVNRPETRRLGLGTNRSETRKLGLAANRPDTKRLGQDSTVRNQRPITKKMSPDMVDFDTFRKQRLQSKRQVAPPKKLGKLSRQRYKMQKGLTGGGEKYQDQKLGHGLDGSMPVGAGAGAKYQNHKIADALHAPKPVNAGSGKKYQDHRLGNGFKGARPIGAGGGAKYQDHKHGGRSQS